MFLVQLLCATLFGAFLSEATILTCNGIKKKERDFFHCIIANQKMIEESDVSFNTSINNVGFNLDEDKKDMLCVDVVDTKLTRLPNELFQIFTNLKMLKLENTGLESWKREYLEGAKFLTVLELVKSSITYFPIEAFAEATELKTLGIINSKMSTINPDMFATLPKLETLSLSFNNFSGDVPVDAFDLLAKTLQYLDLRATRLTKIPSGLFKKLNQMQKLVLLNNNLSSVLDAPKVFPSKLRKVFVGK